MDFYDLKGLLSTLFAGLHLRAVRYEPAEHPVFHPGKCARLLAKANQGEEFVQIGVIGELHPLVRAHYDLPPAPLLAADLDLQALQALIPDRYAVQSVPAFPPVLEDLAIIVEEDVSGERVEALLRQAGGKTLIDLHLFDVYRGEQIGAGKKSLAYSLTYQAADRTLTDSDVAQIRQRIVRRLDQELGAKLRS
jgi:phenylalanyl-tRNA synthetase beta chain